MHETRQKTSMTIKRDMHGHWPLDKAEPRLEGKSVELLCQGETRKISKKGPAVCFLSRGNPKPTGTCGRLDSS